MKTIMFYMYKSNGDTGRGGALFAGAFDEDWVRQDKIFEWLSTAYLLSQEDRCDLMLLNI